MQVVDLGCGNAYLTFAAHRYLTQVRGLPVRVVGVDVKAQSMEHNTEVARPLGIADEATFVQAARSVTSSLAELRRPTWCWRCTPATPPPTTPWPRRCAGEAPLVLAAPCCHHDVAAQLRAAPSRRRRTPCCVRDGILRERFADTLTDALRAATLRLEGYRVDVVEFVESRHTPRNTLLRAVRTGAAGAPDARAELERADRAAGASGPPCRSCSDDRRPSPLRFQLGARRAGDRRRRRGRRRPGPIPSRTPVFSFQDDRDRRVQRAGRPRRRRC